LKSKVVILLGKHETIDNQGIKLLKENYKIFYHNTYIDLLEDSEALLSEAILVRGEYINETLINNMPNLKIIARSGVGTDNINIDIATRKSIYVCNVPDANYISVAEHVIGMLISLSHQIVNGDKSIREGNFDARHQFIGRELSGKTLGIIGFGRIGKLVAQKSLYGLNMNILVYDPYIHSTDNDKITLVKAKEEVFLNSDFISLHLPYNKKLHNFINKKSFKQMKNDAYIINCSRGGLINETELAEAIKNNEIGGAALDVFHVEPPDYNHMLWEVENLIATPHMGASTQEAITRMVLGASKEIDRVLKKQKPENSLNI